MKHSIFAHNFRNVIPLLDIFLSITFKSCMYNTDLYMHVSSLWTVHFFMCVRSGWKDKTMKEYFGGEWYSTGGGVCVCQSFTIRGLVRACFLSVQ